MLWANSLALVYIILGLQGCHYRKRTAVGFAGLLKLCCFIYKTRNTNAMQAVL